MHAVLTRPTRRRGFTLIEVVVSLVVLALLASIALVSYSRVVTKSQDESARLTLHSLMREASILAVQDSSGVAPVTLPHVRTAATDTKTAATTVVVTPGVSAASSFKVLDGLPSTGYGVVSFQAGGPSDPVGAVGSAMLSLSGHCVFARIPQLGAAVQSWVKDVDQQHCDGSFALLGPDAPDPSAPPEKGGVLDLTAAAGDGMVTLQWPNMSGATGYKVFRDGVQMLVVTDIHTVNQYVDYIDNGTQHTYQVIAIDNNKGDLAKSRIVSALPLPPVPATPTNVTGTPGDQANTLSWDPVLRAETYLIFRDGLLLTQVPAKTTRYTDNYRALTNGQAYTYTIVAANMGGQSAPSQPISVTPMPPLPAMPTGLVGSPYDSAVGLQWNSVAHATSYRVYRDGAFIGQFAGTSWTDLTVVNGQTYAYQVSAVNVSGSSTPSAPVDVTPNADASPAPTPSPNDPYGLTGTTTDTTATLHWNAVPGADGYHLYRDGQLLAPTTGTTFTDTGLQPGVTYVYSVASYTTGGEAAGSNPLPLTTTVNDSTGTVTDGGQDLYPPSDPTPGPNTPAAPTGLTGTGGDTQAYLTWNPSDGATNYAIYQDGLCIGTSSGATRITVPNLTNGVQYTFTVAAGNSHGWSAQSNEATVTPHAPVPGLPAPTGVTAVGGTRQITVSWQPVAAADGYRIFVREGRSGTMQFLEPVTGATSTVLSAPDSADWFISVAAYNALSGQSPLSAEVEATTAPASPLSVTAKAGVYTVTVSWAPVATAVSYTVTGPTTVTVTDTSAKFLNLTAGKLYTFTVTATNAAGTSIPSAEVSAIPLSIAPTHLVATGGDGQVSLSWDVLPGATSYRVYRDGQPLTQTTATSYLDTQLTNGTTYTYTVSGALSSGESAKSTPVAATPLPPVPATPTGLTVGAVSTTVALSWNASPYTDHYTLYRNDEVVTTPTGTSYVDTPPPGVTMYYRVSASNLAGESTASPAVAATTVPAPPANFAAVLYNGGVGLSWDASTGATSYTVRRADLSAPVYTGSSTAITDPSTIAGSTYQYTIVATNATGDSPAVTLPVTLPPAPPANFTVVAGDKVVHLNWTASPGATGYRLFRAAAPGSDWLVVDPNITRTSFDDIAVVNGTSYSYKIVAYNVAGTSSDSNVATATPQIAPPAAPVSLAATSGNGTVALSWGRPAGTVDGYRIFRDGVLLTQVTPDTATSFTDTVAAGPNHTYTVAAYNAGGQSPDSALAVAAAGGAPLTPSPLTAAATSATVTLTWAAGGGPGLAPTSYHIFRGGLLLAQVGGSTTSFTDTGLTPTTTYAYQVTASNTYGTSAAASIDATTVESKYATAVLNDHPSGWWRLDEPAGPAAADFSGGGHPGTYATSGVTHAQAGATADGDLAPQFAGPGVTIANFPTLRGSWSVEAWMNGAIYDNVVSDASGNSLIYVDVYGRLFVGYMNGTTYTQIDTGKYVNTGGWHHVVATYSPTGAVAYVDGTPVVSQPWSGVTATATPVSINGYRNATVLIDDVAAYSSTLTAGQVGAHWAGAGHTPLPPTSVHVSYSVGAVTPAWNASPSGAISAYRVYRNGALLTQLDGTARRFTDTTVVTGTVYKYTVSALSSAGEGPQSTAALATPSAYTNAVLSDNPTAWWRLDESSGPSAYEATGNGGNGAYATSDVRFSQAGGTGDGDTAAWVRSGALTFPNAPTLSGTWSVETWVDNNWAYLGDTNAAIISAGPTLSFGYNDGTGWKTLTPTASTGAPGMHQVVVTYSPTGMVAYVDGAVVLSKAWSGVTATGKLAAITGNPNSPPVVDDIAVYSTALTAAQVANHWHAAGH